MSQNLQKGSRLSLTFVSRSVLIFKSSIFDLSGAQGSQEYYLDLYNKDGDIPLRITFRKGYKKIFCSDYTSKSLGDGWGEERSADLGPTVDIDRLKDLGVTISVYNFLTDTKVNRYQILFNLTTVCYFDSRVLGPTVQICYSQCAKRLEILSTILTVVCCALTELQPQDRQAIELGRSTAPSSELPSRSSTETRISIRPSHFMPNQTYASISWDDGKEIRIYHLGPGNILQEYAYSESKGRNSWHYGDLHKLGLVLDPTSSIAAVRHRDDGISLFFQDPNDGLIRALRQSGPTGQWRNDRAEGARAVKGSSIAVVMDDDGLARYRLYYQDPGLYLRERYYIPNATHWPFGDFHPGVQPRGTPITAEVVLGGDVYLNVMWRNSQGRAVVSSWSAASGWEMPNSNGGGTTLDGRD